MEPQVASKVSAARERVLAAPGSHDAWGYFGMVLQAHRLEDDAVVCYRRAIGLAPSEAKWHYLLAHALRDKDPEEALEEAASASRLLPDYAPAYVLRGQLLEASNDVDGALEQYRKAVELDSENTLGEFGVGRILLAKGEAEEALAHLLRARDLSPDSPAIRGSLAQTYRRLGDLDSALRENRLASELSEVIAIHDPIHYAMRKESVSSTAQLERAMDAAQAGDFQTAEALYADLAQLRPEDANIRSRYGDVLARQAKLQPAKVQYEAAIQFSPALASAHYGLGNMLNFEGDYEGAARHYRLALEERPEHLQTLSNLAGILAFRGELEEAAALSRKALELDPKAFSPNFHLGRILLQQSRFREAVPFLEAAVEARNDSGPAHLQLGIALGMAGEPESAWEHVRRASELGETIPPSLREGLQRGGK
jgi:tetratricopeptide (TPR) repeat protein